MDAKEYYYNYVILSLAGLPECKNDDDPELLKAMDAKFKKGLREYEARAAGVKPFDLFTISLIKDPKDKTEFWKKQGYEGLEVPETDCSEVDFIENWIFKLKQGDINTIPLLKRRLLRQFLKFLERKIISNDTGMNGKMEADQLKRLFTKLKGDKYISGREIDFVAAFTPVTLPQDFKPLRWILKSPKGTGANKEKLRAFLEVMQGREVRQTDVQRCFKIELNKRNDNEYHKSNIKHFEALIEKIMK